MSSTPSETQYITVVCRVCGTRVDERAESAPREVPCPDCHKPVLIPGRDQVVVSQKSETHDPGQYRLEIDRNPVTGVKSPRPKRSAEPDGAVLVLCTTCGARMHPPLRADSYRVRCPDCYRPARVPSVEEAAAEVERKRPKVKDEPIETIPLLEPIDSPKPRTYFAVQGNKIRREKAAAPPRYTFFSRVWNFPWQADVLKKWLFLSLGCVLINGFGYLVLQIYGHGQRQVLMTLAFFVLPAIWIFIWTVSYGTTAWLTVITQTAAGNDRIEDWPEQGWRDGLFSFLGLAFLGGVAILIGHGLGLGSVQLGGPYWPWLLATVVLLFPFLALSMLETGAWYYPFSGPVARSLWRNAGSWLLCYLLLGLSYGAYFAAWPFLAGRAPFVAIVVAGPVLAGLWLISGRLLGRLAWRISQVPAESP
jgi:DNA-directed RNA polymerase subunit RPC12/RpoP